MPNTLCTLSCNMPDHREVMIWDFLRKESCTAIFKSAPYKGQSNCAKLNERVSQKGSNIFLTILCEKTKYMRHLSSLSNLYSLSVAQLQVCTFLLEI